MPGMRVTLGQLKAFEAVARLGSFSGAGKELFITQPAVSKKIRQLQDEVAVEEPLEIRLGYETASGRSEESVSITMRTPSARSRSSRAAASRICGWLVTTSVIARWAACSARSANRRAWSANLSVSKSLKSTRIPA